VRVANRTRPRAEALRSDFGAKVVVWDWVQAAGMLEGATTVVNTTSLGMTGKPDFRVPLDAIGPGTVATDIVYTPLMTQFLIEAEARGATIVDGLGMLLHQAGPGFERWFGQRPEVDEATRQAVLGA
jgi:shikimate dehydrogenase